MIKSSLTIMDGDPRTRVCVCYCLVRCLLSLELTDIISKYAVRQRRALGRDSGARASTPPITSALSSSSCPPGSSEKLMLTS